MGALGLVLAGPPPASASAAQPETCPNPGGQAVTATVSSPEPGATVSGVVRVEGTVESSEPVFRVELFVGDARKDVVFPDPPSTNAPFSLVWDSSNRPPGPATLRVVACGGQPAQGSLVRGVTAVDVTVVAPEAGPGTGGALLPAEDRDVESRAPLWVGLIVGVSGLAGLAWSSASARTQSGRRTADP